MIIKLDQISAASVARAARGTRPKTLLGAMGLPVAFAVPIAASKDNLSMVGILAAVILIIAPLLILRGRRQRKTGS